jgi:hypothetical protein
MLGLVIGLAIGLPVGCVSGAHGPPSGAAPSAALPTALTPTTGAKGSIPGAAHLGGSEAGTAQADASAWTYTKVKDDMNGDGVIACTTSTDEVQLTAPYGAVKAELCLRKMPKSGLNAYVRLLGDGQFMCTSYEGCRVRLKFGLGPARPVHAEEPSDNSSNFVFIEDAPLVLAGARKSETALFEANYYQAGEQIVHFPTKGLQWPPPKSVDPG